MGVFTYVLSLYFRVDGIDSSLDSLFESSLVSDQDDLAGLLCYTSTVFTVFVSHCCSDLQKEAFHSIAVS